MSNMRAQIPVSLGAAQGGLRTGFWSLETTPPLRGSNGVLTQTH
jgi:hypothetical protein